MFCLVLFMSNNLSVLLNIYSNLDILEERIRERGRVRTIKVGGQTQEWAYRSEVSEEIIAFPVYLF